MEPITQLQIACQGNQLVPLDDLHDLQGNLKDLSEENYAKLRNSLIEYGFSFPIFFWQDETGKKWILDAHQRMRTLRKMREENILIPDLPADPVFAKDKIEAKKKLLLLNSRFGKITREGYDEFIDDPDAKIIESDISDILEIPEIEVYADHARNGTTGTSPSDDQSKVREITCPHCQGVIRLFENKIPSE